MTSLIGVNNCVGWRNYKFFLLFLFYGCVFCLFILASSLPFIVVQFASRDVPFNYQWMLMLIIASAFGLALVMFGAMHLRLLFINQTTIEDMEKVREKTVR